MKYKDAGVDVERGYEAVRKIKDIVGKTFNDNVLTGIGDFGAAFAIPGSEEGNILVSGTDGVGTKLKLAFATDRHDTIGIDCVAMCVNDILCSGAKPLFFLDYLATGEINPDRVAEIVSGIANGCKQAGAALIGGETAEMPDFYPDGEYDLAGFAVGMVKQKDLIDKKRVKDGDAIIGIASSGIHSNGYSLVRKLFDKNDYEQLIDRQKVIDILLTPTKIYVQPVQQIILQFALHAMAHITGGGFYENIPRALPDGLGAEINAQSWPVPGIFTEIQKRAGLDDTEMFSTFNMGIGFILIVDHDDSDAVLKSLVEHKENAYLIGNVREAKNGKIWFQ